MVKRRTILAGGIALIIASQVLKREPEETQTRAGGGSGGIFSFLTGPQNGKKETTITETVSPGAQPTVFDIPSLPGVPTGFFDEPQPLFTPVPPGQQQALDLLRARFRTSETLFTPLPTPPSVVSKKAETVNLTVIPQQTISPFKTTVSRPSTGITILSTDPGAMRLKKSLALEGATSTPLFKKVVSIGPTGGIGVVGGSERFGGG